MPDTPHFVTINPDNAKWRFRVDNHILSTFDRCGQLGEYSHIQLWKKKGPMTGKAMSVGIWWSRTLELIYTEMSYGTFPSLERCHMFATQAWNEQIVKNELPPDTQADFGGGDAALLMVSDYYYKYLEQDFRDWKIVGAEVGFGMNNELPLHSPDDPIEVYYTGKPDLVVFEYSSGKLVVVDHKTKDYIKSNTNREFKPYPQFAGYVYAVSKHAEQLGYSSTQTGRIIANVAGRKPPSDKPRDGVKKPRFIRVFPTFSEAEVEEWRWEVVQKCLAIYSQFHHGFIKRENSCHLYSGCAFRDVCAKPHGARDIVLQADFNKVAPWTPYTEEESED